MRKTYPTDLSDAEWTSLRSYLRNLAIQALHICVVSLAESVRIMELVYPIPMRFTDSGKPLWARFSATGGTDMCKGSMAKFVAQQLRLALQPSAHLLQSGNLFVAHCDHKVLPYQNMRLAEVHSLGFVQVTSSLEHDEYRMVVAHDLRPLVGVYGVLYHPGG